MSDSTSNKYLSTKETRERLTDRLRGSGADKATAERLADASLRRVEKRLEDKER